MALIVPRTAMVDDDGSGTIGTIFNNAWKTALYNEIDIGLTPGMQTTALVGTQSIAVTSTTRVLRCSNATLLTIQSLTGGFDGQLITITANGAGQVDVPDGGGIANGILGGAAVSVNLSLAPGSASPFHNGRMTVMFDASVPRWKVLHHEQGAWLPYTPVWGNTGTANTIGASGLTGAYHLSGRTCRFRISHTWGAGAAGGNGVYTYSYPFTAAAGTVSMPFIVAALDSSASSYFVAFGKYFTATAFVPYGVGAPGGFTNAAPFTWANTDVVTAAGILEL